MDRGRFSRGRQPNAFWGRGGRKRGDEVGRGAKKFSTEKCILMAKAKRNFLV